MYINGNALLTKGASVNASKTNFNTSAPIHSAIDQFRQAMRSEGIHCTGEIIPNGKLQRAHNEGDKQGTKNIAYTLHLDGCPAGWFKDHKSGIEQTWRSANVPGISYDRTQQIKESKEAKRQREAETLQKYTKAAEKANYIWRQSKPIARKENHKYLITKQIQQHDTRLYRDALVIPIYNESDQLVNIQHISPEGEKRFLTGGRKRGCFHILGDLSQRILICEGFATGASLYEDCGQRVVIAFDAGNLLSVAKNIRELAPDTEIIICGDNDLSGVGQAKAQEAAESIGGKFFIPPVPGQDWNDYLTGGRQHA